MAEQPYLLTREDIDAMSGLAKTHFLNPNAKRLNKSLGDATGLTGFGFHLIDVAPGDETTEYHLHHFEDECVYVLSGRATAFVGEERFEIKAGDFLGYRKGGPAHAIKNTGDETLRCIVVGERLAHDVSDYPWQAKRLYRNAGLAWDIVDHTAIANPGGSVGRKA